MREIIVPAERHGAPLRRVSVELELLQRQVANALDQLLLG
jgi:hypothetical protein